MRLLHPFATFLLCLLLAGCSTSTAFSNSSVKTITLDTKGVPENLTVYINGKPQPNKTNNGELKLTVPEGQPEITVKNEKPLITYQVELPKDGKSSASLKIDPTKNEELNHQVADLLTRYFQAINEKKNALSFLSKDSILDPKNMYKNSYKSAVLYTGSFKTSMINNKPELIVLVDAENRQAPSDTRTYQFRLLWEDEKWQIFHQQLLYEVFDGKLLYENEKGSYPGKQSPGPQDIVLSF